jgi:hypothetical protein
VSYSSNIQATVTATATPRAIIPIFTKNNGALSGSVIISRIVMTSRQVLGVERCSSVVLRKFEVYEVHCCLQLMCLWYRNSHPVNSFMRSAVARDWRSRFTGGHDFILAPAQGQGCVFLSCSTRGSPVSVCLDFSVNVVPVLLKPLYTAVQNVLFILLSANDATFRHFAHPFGACRLAAKRPR